MIFLKNDYGLGAHPKVLQALIDNNMTLSNSYSNDTFCQDTTAQVRQLIQCPAADVYYFSGGTQTNKVCLSAFLRPYEAVIAAESSHIGVHETGAIEATGHKCILVPSANGKILPEQIDHVVAFHNFDQMVLPKVVYISNTTEVGTVYSKAEIQALRACCDKNKLYLYIDGARMAMALASPDCGMTFADYAALSDAFYIGGTKCGALFGELLVLVNDALKPNFRYVMRQNGALFAKGMVLGMQFAPLLRDGLYERLGKHANDLALELAGKMADKGFAFHYTPQSNQIFPIVTKELAEKLAESVMYEVTFDNGDGTLTIRFVTSWASTQQDIDAVAALL
jgi:threonine aldolase